MLIAVSVLPTPLGPTSKNTPSGVFGFLSPAVEICRKVLK